MRGKRSRPLFYTRARVEEHITAREYMIRTIVDNSLDIILYQPPGTCWVPVTEIEPIENRGRYDTQLIPHSTEAIIRRKTSAATARALRRLTRNGVGRFGLSGSREVRNEKSGA